MPCSNVSGNGGVHWIAGQEQESAVGINAVDFSVDLKVCAAGLLRQFVGSPEGEALWRECGFPGGGFFSVEQEYPLRWNSNCEVPLQGVEEYDAVYCQQRVWGAVLEEHLKVAAAAGGIAFYARVHIFLCGVYYAGGCQ